MYGLKRLDPKSVKVALDKASQYRDLNQPEEAESICRDVLDIEPANTDALRLLGLALSDQLVEGQIERFDEAMAVFSKLPTDYERCYYRGLVHERAGKAHLQRREAHNALASFEHALTEYERAEQLAPEGLPDPILRWNRCVRVLTTHPLLKDAADVPRESHPRFSD